MSFEVFNEWVFESFKFDEKLEVEELTKAH